MNNEKALANKGICPNCGYRFTKNKKGKAGELDYHIEMCTCGHPRSKHWIHPNGQMICDICGDAHDFKPDI